MKDDRLDISSNSKISMPIFNLIGIIAMVGTVVLMYSSITQKITSLETSRVLAIWLTWLGVRSPSSRALIFPFILLKLKNNFF